MKGLSNRFNQDRLRAIWTFHFSCLWCGKSGADCFHHIISPSSPNYRKGRFNSSVFNALPMHNFGCHIDNPKLHEPETEKKLLRRVLKILIKKGVVFNELDKEFLKVYGKLYGNCQEKSSEGA